MTISWCTVMACSICQFCYSGTSSKLVDLSQNCVLESTELILPIPNISWNSRIRIQNSTWRHAREQCCTVKCKKTFCRYKGMICLFIKNISLKRSKAMNYHIMKFHLKLANYFLGHSLSPSPLFWNTGLHV